MNFNQRNAEVIGKRLAVGIRRALREVADDNLIYVDTRVVVTDAAANQLNVAVIGMMPVTKTIVHYNGVTVGDWLNHPEADG